MRKRDECNGRLRDVGALPAAELAALAGGKRKRDLMGELAKVNDELKSFAHVNKKAMEQYSAEQKAAEDLAARKAEVEQGDASIHDLIATLDAKKDEAIVRTFKGVAKHFAAVFSELVPKGSASMTIVTADQQDRGDYEQADSTADSVSHKRKSKSGASETFVGLSVQASFTDADEVANSTALSGGQRTLLGLACTLHS